MARIDTQGLFVHNTALFIYLEHSLFMYIMTQSMGKTTTETQLLDQAIKKFGVETGVDITVLACEHPVGKGKQVDALADVRILGETYTYAIEVKKNLTTAALGLAVQRLKEMPYKPMLVAEYVNPNMAERLRKMEIAFLDLAGNAYLNQKPTLIYIKGNRATEKLYKTKNLKPTRAFQATGLKVILGLLMRPDLTQKAYRDIAEATDVALGTVGWVLNDLREHGYLYEKNKKNRWLTQKDKIIEQWIAAYPERLRPKLKLGIYKAENKRWWQDADLIKHEAQWGGEVAAAKLTNYLVPEKVVIYADKIPVRLLAENKMTRDPEGNVEILKRFWNPELFYRTLRNSDIPEDIAPPFLVYADLIATGDARNIETANMIRKDYIDGYLGQN